MLRDYSPSVYEIASRDHSRRQVSAWAPEPPNLEAWARRLDTGSVFVYERNDEIAGFARIDSTGHLDLLYVHPEIRQ